MDAPFVPENGVFRARLRAGNADNLAARVDAQTFVIRVSAGQPRQSGDVVGTACLVPQCRMPNLKGYQGIRVSGEADDLAAIIEEERVPPRIAGQFGKLNECAP